MPDYYTHLKFGQAVLSRLCEPLAEKLRREGAAFRLGCFGPDPLLFHRPLLPSAVRAEGRRAHRESAGRALERLRPAVKAGRPQAWGYAAGFLCHFALDSACHEYIETVDARGGVTHAGMEAELDRTMKAADGLDPLRESGLPAGRWPEGLWPVAALAYKGITPRQMRGSTAAFLRVSRLQTRAAGTRVQWMLNWLARHSVRCAPAEGAVLGRTPDPRCAETTEELLRRFGAAVEETPAQMEAFFRAVEADEPLAHWLDRNFSGRLPGQAREGAVPSGAAR